MALIALPGLLSQLPLKRSFLYCAAVLEFFLRVLDESYQRIAARFNRVRVHDVSSLAHLKAPT